MTQPTLLLWGERDALFPRQDQDRLAAAIPRAQLRVYQDTGHCPQLGAARTGRGRHSGISLRTLTDDGVPQRRRSSKHRGHISGQREALAHEILSRAGHPGEIVLAVRIALVNRRARISRSIALSASARKRLERSAQARQIPQIRKLGHAHVPSRVRAERHGDFRKTHAGDVVAVRVDLRHEHGVGTPPRTGGSLVMTRAVE